MARADIKRVALSAAIHTNWMPRTMGSMMLRPGLGYLGASRSNLQAYHLPFIFSTSDKALLELTDQMLRIWVDDALVTRLSVSTTIANDTFDTDVASWTDADESGGTSAWVTGGYLGLTGNGTAFAIRRQEVTVAGADQNVEHGLSIAIERGPVLLRVGSSSGEDDYIRETTLDTGEHRLALTPTGNFWVEFKSRLKRQVLVDACEIDAAGTLEIPTPWEAADLSYLRFDQSGDIVYVGCVGYQQWKIERRAAHSWSVALYQADDGPFLPENVSTTTITAAAISGNTTLTASKPLFRSTHVGALFRLTSVGQTVSSSIGAEDTFTNTIRVTGVSTARSFTIVLTGLTASGSTVTLQRSFDEGASWIDVANYTTDQSTTYADGLDNQDILYRVGVKTGNYGAGTQVCTLAITTGSITGVGRVTAFTSSTVVSAEVIRDFGGTTATAFWNEGEWSDFRGWPHAPVLVEGRLGWAGKDGVWLSISDNYVGFDDEFEGDAGPISRTIGAGPVDTINWAKAVQRLILGGEGAEFSARSSNFDSPMTPTDFVLKPASRQGSAPVDAVVADAEILYVQRGGTRVYEAAWGQNGTDYESTNVCAIVPEIGKPRIVRLAIQRQPDTRLHAVRSDGTAAVLIYDRVENVLCWVEVETDGLIEDAVVLPGSAGSEEDQVYYSVARTVNGSTVRYLERWAMETECGELTQNKQADAFIAYSQAGNPTISGLSHLEGEQVVVWDAGVCLADASGDIETFTVTAGAISATHDGAARNATTGVVGKAYQARFKSARLVELAEALGGSLNSTQNIHRMGLILADTHAKGLRIGQDFTNMEELPDMEDWKAVDPDTVHEDLTTEPIELPGEWTLDSRVCLEANAPRPATVLAALAEVEHHG